MKFSYRIILVLSFLVLSNKYCLANHTFAVFDTSANKKPLSISKTLFLNNFEKELSNANDFMQICENSKLLLKAPFKNKQNIVFWECPDGQKIYAETLLIEKVSLKNAGIYKLKIFSADENYEGNINVKVIKKVLNSVSNSSFCEGQEIVIRPNNTSENVNLTWIDQNMEVISKEKTLHIGYLPVGDYSYLLKTKAEGCESSLELPIKIIERPFFSLIAQEDENDKIRLKVIGNPENAQFLWDGNFLNLSNTSMQQIDKPAKGKHEYKCTIKLDSCEVIAKASIEIN